MSEKSGFLKWLKSIFSVSALGFILAIVAIYFDVFSFGVDREENRNTSELLQELTQRGNSPNVLLSPTDVTFNISSLLRGEYLVNFEEGQYSTDCRIRWNVGYDSYLLRKEIDRKLSDPHPSLSLHINHPEFDHFLSSEWDSWLFRMDEQELERSVMSANGYPCGDHILELGYRPCFGIEGEEVHFNMFRKSGNMVLRPNDEEWSEFIRSEGENVVQTFQELLEDFLEEQSENDRAYTEISTKITEENGVWSKTENPFGTERTTHYQLYENAIWTVQKSTEGDWWEREFAVYFPPRPNVDAWMPSGSRPSYAFELDKTGIVGAIDVAKECESVPKYSRAEYWIAELVFP